MCLSPGKIEECLQRIAQRSMVHGFALQFLRDAARKWMVPGQVLDSWEPPLPEAQESFLPLLFSECLLRSPESWKGTTPPAHSVLGIYSLSLGTDMTPHGEQAYLLNVLALLILEYAPAALC